MRNGLSITNKSVPVSIVYFGNDEEGYFLKLLERYVIIFVVFFVEEIGRVGKYLFLPSSFQAFLLVSQYS
jgi:hypothetical protein